MENYTNRKEYIGKLLSYKDKDLIKVVSGLRRSGKSTLLELYREALLKLDIGKMQIQFYNFELPENFVNKNPHSLFTAHFFEKSPWQATFNLRLHWRDPTLRLLPLDNLLGGQLMLDVLKRHSVRHRV